MGHGMAGCPSGIVVICLLAVIGPVAPSAAEQAPALAENNGLTSQDLEHGKQQVRNMLRDRPAMAEHVEENDIIWQWAARQFAGQDVGSRVVWDANSPTGNTRAEYTYPRQGRPAAIRVNFVGAEGRNDKKPLTFEESWECLADAFCELRYTRELDRLVDDALNGRISKREFVLGCTRTEYQSLVQLKAFRDAIWAPWAAQKHLQLGSFDLLDDFLPSYEAWVGQYKNDESAPLGTKWSSIYDSRIRPSMAKLGIYEPTRWTRSFPYLLIAVGVVVFLLFVYAELRHRRKAPPRTPISPGGQHLSQSPRS
jgi:hypothetical protein